MLVAAPCYTGQGARHVQKAMAASDGGASGLLSVKLPCLDDYGAKTQYRSGAATKSSGSKAAAEDPDSSDGDGSDSDGPSDAGRSSWVSRRPQCRSAAQASCARLCLPLRRQPPRLPPLPAPLSWATQTRRPAMASAPLSMGSTRSTTSTTVVSCLPPYPLVEMPAPQPLVGEFANLFWVPWGPCVTQQLVGSLSECTLWRLVASRILDSLLLVVCQVLWHSG